MHYIKFYCRKLQRNNWIRYLKLIITKTRLFKYIENFTHKKMANFQIKKSDIFHISVQNIDCGYSLEPPRRGGSNDYPQSMFLSRNNKNNVYPCKPQFYSIKVGLWGSKLYRFVFVMYYWYEYFIKTCVYLTEYTTLWANSADNKIDVCFLLFFFFT